MKITWTSKDNSASFKQGWGLFWVNCHYTAKQGKPRHEIMKYDEDQSQKTIPDDTEAVEFVLRHAKKSKICRKAVKIVYGI